MKYECSVPYEVITVTSPDGSRTHKIGFVATLSNDPKLYSHFKEPAFGGANIEDPWDTLAHYKQILENEHGCDLVIPLEHMYVHENTKTTEIYKDDRSIPLILSGHDHHRIDQVINNTRLIKPGMDGVTAAVIEIVFDRDNNQNPKIRSSFVETNTFEPCPTLKAKTDKAYDVLLPLKNTQLASILPQFLPLTSKNARGSTCTMGKLICSMLKQALWQSYYKGEDCNNSKKIDAVILMGGNIRGNEDYPEDAFFSLETLEAEIKPDEVIGFVDIPGHVLAAGIEYTHSGDPRPGWFQYDDGVTQEPGTNRVLTVGGKPLEPHRVYRVATKIKDLTNGQR
jgi:2',3'-cyclic-nucleotide 2'-phosphodiesterase (5'-nucleotidase family)